ncbi:glycoside hydrolase family protein [Flavobacterium algicola]|uniref:glycoside hydrolase family protein n=1 Tax=Flavobacterium algicola TaxID=556529 RepID=UPI001EFE857F|nr:glycoside hydrolase family protein [Flavobacterium algicola]MCG9792293.1 glycoside hydrolase family protein [Flavobacterium algicola]
MKIIKNVILIVTALYLLPINCQGIKTRTVERMNIKNTNKVPTSMSDRWKFVGQAVNEPGYDIWGSSPIRDEEGNIHLFCARWPSDTPFKTAWRYKSEIAHYTANNPEGPFQFKDVIGKGKNNQKWNAAGFHNPSVKKIDNQYVIVYIANDGDQNHGPSQRIGMLISDNLNGPWSEIPNENTPLLSPPADATIWCYESALGVNNPSLIKHPNGSYLLYFKAKEGAKGKVSMGVAVSSNLKGPYIIQPNPITTNNVRIEDGNAFLWRNKICLMTTDNHGILEEGGGLLWVSEDGLTFNSEPLSGFHNFQNYYLKGSIPKVANPRYGVKVKFERPQLLMDANNEPEYLYCPSGVALDGSDGTNSYVLKYQKN